MGSLERRIEETLEASFAGSAASRRDTTSRAKVLDDFARRALDAMASIRRAPIDAEPHRYGAEKLKGEAPITVAAHVAALAALGHEDEDEVRDILEHLEHDRGLDPARHEALIGAFAGLVERVDFPE